MLRCQSPFWCIPPALASSWPRTPAPTTETFQGFSGSVFTLQQIALLSFSVSAQWTEATFSHPNILVREQATASKIKDVPQCEWQEIKSSDSLRFREWTRFQRLSSVSARYMLPLSAGRACVKAMISLRLLLQWAGPVDLRFKSM